MFPSRSWLVVVPVLLVPHAAFAETIYVTPSDSYDVIEGARAGDEVVIAPGTYQFRVDLANSGTPDSKIIIRAEDPNDRPVWDLDGQATSDWPGSYTGGDRGRGCWQVRGDHIVISGIVFDHCNDTSGSAIRAVNVNDLTVRDCVVRNSTNGITGTADPFTIEHTVFTGNGQVFNAGDNPSHSLYIYGGTLVLRYNLFADTVEGQSFHVRARDSVIEYNWIQNPGSYVGDIMTCERFCGGTDGEAITQRMLLRGNVILQGNPSNVSQLIALYNDEGGSNDGSGDVGAMEITMAYNTIVGTPGVANEQRLVNMRNDSVDTHVILDNNVIHQVKDVAEPREAGLSNWSIAGTHNWLDASTDAGELSASVTGSDPGFANVSADDYRPSGASALVGAAGPTSVALPDRELYENPANPVQYRVRASADDIGAFEHDTDGPPFGPYDEPPQGTGGAGASGGAGGSSAGGSDVGGASAGGGGGGAAGADTSDDGGCGCVIPGRRSRDGAWWLLAPLAWLVSRRRR